MQNKRLIFWLSVMWANASFRMIAFLTIFTLWFAALWAWADFHDRTHVTDAQLDIASVPQKEQNCEAPQAWIQKAGEKGVSPWVANKIYCAK